ncbi:MAG: hypothetical protein IPG93_22290 [Burkholderiales bacterium]|nr:hypothetical protein [Burkholderiales bacterium]
MRPFIADLFCAALLSLGAASASWAGQAPSPVGSAPHTPAPGGDHAPATTAARSIPTDSRISPTEQRWLQGAWPVITHARQTGVPLDVIVQPQPMPGAAPLAMAFVDGRCKLVLSMRGNAQAQATLDAIAPPLLDATLELMAAHELGHCRRYLDGAWYGLPAGFVAAVKPPAGLNAELAAMYAKMQATRREEAYGDLVGLAWTRQHHSELYSRLHAWLMAERATDLIPGSHHDTLAWLRLAGNGTALDDRSIFAGAATVWANGLNLAP